MIYDPDRYNPLQLISNLETTSASISSQSRISNFQEPCGSPKLTNGPAVPPAAPCIPQMPLATPVRLGERISTAIELLSWDITSTPSLFIDRSILRSNLALWQQQLPLVPPFFAMKANNDPLVLQELFAQGANADVASAYEIDVARALGLTGDRMILSNPRKDLATIRTMKAARIWATTVDSPAEIDKLVQEGIPTGDYNPVLFFRIKVPTEGVTQDLNSKFGVQVLPKATTIGTDRADLTFELDDLRAMLRKASQVGFTRLGLAFHVGTQCTNPQVYEFAMAIVQHLAELFRSESLPVNHLDIGGGFPDERIAFAKNQQAIGDPRVELLRAVGRAAEHAIAAGFQVIAEPGRYLVADAGFLVTRVSYVHSTDSAIQIDDGIYRTLSGRIHDDRDYQFHAVCADENRPSVQEAVSPMTVWGCSCDSFDKVSDGALIPREVEVGDYLLVEGLGAYSTSFGSNTNGFAPATVVVYHYDGDQLQSKVSPLAEQNELIIQELVDWAAGNQT